jgi:hypothetical protein
VLHLLAHGELDEGWVAVPPGLAGAQAHPQTQRGGTDQMVCPALCQTIPAAYESIRGSRVT